MRCCASTIAYIVCGVCLVTLLSVSLAVAQTDGTPFRNPDGAGGGNERRGPDTADTKPRSDQRVKLAHELRLLKSAEARMGAKHPELQAVRKKIAKVIEQLDALAEVAPDTRPQTKPAQAVAQMPAIAGMSDDQLRQLIQRMALKIEQLERRIDSLERLNEVY